MSGGLETIPEVEETIHTETQFQSTRINFIGNNDVFKVGNSVFLIGFIDYSYLNSNFSNSFLNNIISLLSSSSCYSYSLIEIFPVKLLSTWSNEIS